MEANYQFLKARSLIDYSGGAHGDRIDRDQRNQKNDLKNYRNFEMQVSQKLKARYRKVHQDAE